MADLNVYYSEEIASEDRAREPEPQLFSPLPAKTPDCGAEPQLAGVIIIITGEGFFYC